MRDIQFGAMVQVSATLKRDVEYRPHSRVTSIRECWKVWQRKDAKQRSAVFLGVRALRDGVRDWEPEVGPTFLPHGPVIRAALVCFGPRSKPVYAPLDAITTEAPDA